MVLLRHDDDSLDEEEAKIESKEEPPTVDMKTMQLSFSSSKGLTSTKSFKVWGEILGRPMIILIDLGVTCNFLSKTITEELKLEIAKTPKYTMEVGNGQLESSQGVCKEASVWV